LSAGWWLVAGDDFLWEKNTVGWLVLNWCERKILLAGWEPASRTRPRSLTKSSWMRSNSAKLRASSLFFG
jgi:hypothetical protein